MEDFSTMSPEQLRAKIAEMQAAKGAKTPRVVNAEAVPLTSTPATPPIPVASATDWVTTLFDGAPPEDLVDATLSAIPHGGTHGPFLTLCQDNTNSTSGGGLKSAYWIAAEDAIALPEGSRGFFGVFLGYRMTVSGWPSGYDPTVKSKPIVSATAITAADVGLVMQAGAAYQRCPADKKYHFDHTGDGSPCHLRPQVEVLVLISGHEKPIVVQGASHFDSAEATVKEIATLRRVAADQATLVLRPLPIQVVPAFANKTSRTGKTWRTNWLRFASDPTKDTEAHRVQWENYTRYVAGITPEQRKEVQDWLRGVDSPMTDRDRDILRVCARVVV